jgi:hypothetical protein
MTWTSTTPLSPDFAAAVAAVWGPARARWASALLLSRPTGAPPDLHAPAAISLATREIVLHEPMIRARGLTGALEGIVAHEVGHHVAFPGTLVTEARLRLTERSLLPFERFSLTNLFNDLLINELLGRDVGLRHQLSAVYAAFAVDDAPADPRAVPGAGGSDPKSEHRGLRHPERDHRPTAPKPTRADDAPVREHEHRPDFVFAFVMTAYEELWQLPQGSLAGWRAGPLVAQFPGARADAQLLVERLFFLGPNLYTQYLFFLSVVMRYIVVDKDAAEPHVGDPCPCGGGEPSAEDWAEALTPVQLEEEALARALREGWLSAKEIERLKDGRTFERRIAGLPGQRGADASMVPEVMAAWYRRQAAAHLLRPPPVRLLGDATVPTDLVPWEPGDAVVDVDWAQTLREMGPRLGRATPLVRTRIADEEGLDVDHWAPRTELYVDVSGSMPDPCAAKNAMSLAAMVLAVATLRHQGAVRALLYSGDHVRLWEWSRSEVEVSRFLMHYMGGGTVFPFAVLRESCAERLALPGGGRVRRIRVVITDRDFDTNVDGDASAGELLRAAAAQSAPFVLLQLAPRPERVALYTSFGLRVVGVRSMDDFPGMAAALARALFPPASSPRGHHGAA